MFKTTPKIYAHKSAMNYGNFVTPEIILNKGSNTEANLFHRYCPHRMYPMHVPGEVVQEVSCKFHNFKWAVDGTPLNNPKKLACGTIQIGRSGLVFKDFVEPTHSWVDDLAAETELEYSHSCLGSSNGSWLWLMDAEADYLHVYQGGIHPRLSTIIDLDKTIMEQGDGWILQTHKPEWWSLYIYPYTFIEHCPGCLSVNYVVPSDPKSEFKFDWITQFYYNSNVSTDLRTEFETLEDVFREDVAAIELQKGNYFPLMNATNRYEDHCVHFGEWYRKNKVK
jgi:phenylpropionate dioxygenase-like ring-hydroxylating dioxygenase large terminal subunit